MFVRENADGDRRGKVVGYLVVYSSSKLKEGTFEIAGAGGQERKKTSLCWGASEKEDQPVLGDKRERRPACAGGHQRKKTSLCWGTSEKEESRSTSMLG